jgi:pyridoxal phosphate enzyme (YggS family)
VGTGVADRIARVEERLEAACRRAGRKREEVRLMAVTKFHPAEAVEEAWRGGLRLFGENRVQEAGEKFPPLRTGRAGLELHLIGTLQRNKAKAAAALFDCVESVDRDSLLETLGGLTAGRGKPLPVLLELHTGEESKAGYPDADALCRAAEKALGFPGLRVSGLMTMAPFTSSKEAVRASFRALAGARAFLRARFPDSEAVSWDCLSMGMSGDFETAVEEGSTLVRIGTALFGERPA